MKDCCLAFFWEIRKEVGLELGLCNSCSTSTTFGLSCCLWSLFGLSFYTVGKISKINNYQDNFSFQGFHCFWYCRWGWGCSLCLSFGLLCLKIGEVVDSCKLNKSREDKSKAHSYEPVHGGCIGHFWQGVPGTDA